MKTQQDFLIKDFGLSAQHGPAWLATVRKQGLERFTKLGLPTTKDEEWKYTNIAPIAQRKFQIPTDGNLIEKDEFNRYCGKDTIKIVFVNGIYSESLSNLKSVPKGVVVTTLKKITAQDGAALEALYKKFKPEEETAFIALNNAAADDSVYIHVNDKIVCKDMIHIVHITSLSANDAIIHPRALITLGQSAEATVLESHVGFSDKPVYLTNALTDIFLSANATLTYTKLQKEGMNAYHIGNTRVYQEKDSTLNGFSFMNGGALTRNNLNIALNGEGCNSVLNGLYCLNGSQLADNHTSVDHRFPNCTSNQLYKGILNGASRAVFNGKIFVKPIAQKTNSYQLNKNLLIGKDCRVDTKPQLEIFADDVKCTHGATIGQLNEDEIFYLQSRSIGRKTAIKMLSKGFVDGIIETIPTEAVREKANILLEPTFASL